MCILGVGGGGANISGEVVVAGLMTAFVRVAAEGAL